MDIEEYDQGSAWLRFKYIFVYLAVFRSCLIYLSDVAAVVFLFYPLQVERERERVCACIRESFDACPLIIFQVDTIGTSFSPPAVAGLEFLKWMYLFCLVMAIVLLAIDIRKAKRIVESRDISLAFTSTIAYRYYSIQWYPYYCFFAEVRTMTKLKDNIALFVFFRLRGMCDNDNAFYMRSRSLYSPRYTGWKRLLLVEAPRNMISIFTLYFAYKRIFEKGNSANLIATVGLALITMSTAFFVFSALTTVIALYMYLPLVMDVQGNLKEYVCHKINKR